MTRQLFAALITLATSFALATLTLATPASAQQVDGALRLHLEVDVLSIVTTSPEEGDSNTETSIGPGAGGLGFGIGYGLSEHLIVGGNMTLQHRDGGGDNDGVLTLSLLPYLELMFGGGDLRPFVGGNLILALSSSDNVSRTEFGLGGLGGVHFFLSDTFSFDLSGRLFFTAGSVTVDTAAGDVDSSFTSVGMLVLVGVSGWSI